MDPNSAPTLHLAGNYAPGALRTSLHAGEVTRVRRGVYTPATTGSVIERHRATLLARCTAAARTLSGRFAFSHQTAAFLHGLPVTVRSDVAHLVQQIRPQGDSAHDLIRHHTCHLPDEDITMIAGLPVTTMPRTLVDCARALHPREGLCVADAILRRLTGMDRFRPDRGLTSQQRLREELVERVRQLGRAPGVVRARAIVAYADGRAESPGESRLRWVVLKSGFAAPILQPCICTAVGDFYADLGWRSEEGRPTQWVLAEYDGVTKYQANEDLYREKQREDALRDAGCVVIRATKQDIAHPGRLTRLLQRHVPGQPLGGPDRRGLAPPLSHRPR